MLSIGKAALAIAAMILLLSNFASAERRVPEDQNRSDLSSAGVVSNSIGQDPHLQNIFVNGVTSELICTETVSKLLRVDGIRMEVSVSYGSHEGVETMPVSTCEQLRSFQGAEHTRDVVEKVGALRKACDALSTLQCDGSIVGAVNVFRVNDGKNTKCKAILPGHFLHEQKLGGDYKQKNLSQCELFADSRQKTKHTYSACKVNSAGRSADSHFMCYDKSRSHEIGTTKYKDDCTTIRGDLVGPRTSFEIGEMSYRMSFNYSSGEALFSDEMTVDVDDAYCTAVDAPELKRADVRKQASVDCDYISAASINGVEFIDYNQMPGDLKQPGYPVEAVSSNMIKHPSVTFKGTSGSITWCYDKKTGEMTPLYMGAAMRVISSDLIDIQSGYVLGDSLILQQSDIVRYGTKLDALFKKH